MNVFKIFCYALDQDSTFVTRNLDIIRIFSRSLFFLWLFAICGVIWFELSNDLVATSLAPIILKWVTVLHAWRLNLTWRLMINSLANSAAPSPNRRILSSLQLRRIQVRNIPSLMSTRLCFRLLKLNAREFMQILLLFQYLAFAGWTLVRKNLFAFFTTFTRTLLIK